MSIMHLTVSEEQSLRIPGIRIVGATVQMDGFRDMLYLHFKRTDSTFTEQSAQDYLLNTLPAGELRRDIIAANGFSELASQQTYRMQGSMPGSRDEYVSFTCALLALEARNRASLG